MSFRFYVYAYLRLDGSPYYIGKGKNNRAWIKGKHEIKLPTDVSRVVIVEKNLNEIGALAIERRLIRWYGRKDIGTGLLRNKTDGGEGVSNPAISRKGIKRGPTSEKTKEKLRLAKRNISDITRKKMRESAAIRSPISDVARANFSNSRKNVPKTEEHKNKLRLAAIKWHSEKNEKSSELNGDISHNIPCFV